MSSLDFWVTFLPQMEVMAEVWLDPGVEMSTWLFIELRKERWPGVMQPHHPLVCQQNKENKDTKPFLSVTW